MSDNEIKKVARKAANVLGLVGKNFKADDIQKIEMKSTDFVRVIVGSDDLEIAFDVDTGRLVPESVRMA